MALSLLLAKLEPMNIRITLRSAFTGMLLFFLAARVDLLAKSPDHIGVQNDRETAEQLWEQAIAAKGGRERLYSVNNLQLSIREKQWAGFRRASFIIEGLYVFSEKSEKYWEWSDQRPMIFGLWITMHNWEKHIHWGYIQRGNDNGSLGPIHEGYRGSISYLIYRQLDYLMETQWVKPIPVSVERGKVGGHPVDIVHTVVKEFPKGDERISFALDRKSHLPLQVIYHTITFGQEHSGGPRLSDYTEVSGIQMPAKVDGFKTNYQFNVEYDQRVFEQPPSEAAGLTAWKRSNR